MIKDKLLKIDHVSSQINLDTKKVISKFNTNLVINDILIAENDLTSKIISAN